jgi:hypothetical protein
VLYRRTRAPRRGGKKKHDVATKREMIAAIELLIPDDAIVTLTEFAKTGPVDEDGEYRYEPVPPGEELDLGTNVAEGTLGFEWSAPA